MTENWKCDHGKYADDYCAECEARDAAPAREPEAAQCSYVTYFSSGAYASCILDAGHGGGHKNHSFYNVSANAVWEFEREKEISKRPGLLATMESLRAHVSQIEQELRHAQGVCDCHTWPTVKEFHEYTVAVEAERDAMREALREAAEIAKHHARGASGRTHNHLEWEAVRFECEQIASEIVALTPDAGTHD